MSHARRHDYCDADNDGKNPRRAGRGGERPAYRKSRECDEKTDRVNTGWLGMRTTPDAPIGAIGASAFIEKRRVSHHEKHDTDRSSQQDGVQHITELKESENANDHGA